MLTDEWEIELPHSGVEHLVLRVETLSPVDRDEHGQTANTPALVHFATALVDAVDDDLHVTDLTMPGRRRALHTRLLSISIGD